MPVVFVRDRVEDRHQKLHHRKSWTGTGNEREIFPPAFFPYFSRFFLTGFLPFFFRNFSRFYVRTMKLWIQHVLDHYSAITRYCYVKPFLNPWLITALTGTPVSIDNEVFQTEEIYIIVCCLIKDLSLLFYYSKYYTIHMGFNTLF